MLPKLNNKNIKIKKVSLKKNKEQILSLYLISIADSVGSENCCNGSFACCGANSCG